MKGGWGFWIIQIELNMSCKNIITATFTVQVELVFKHINFFQRVISPSVDTCISLVNYKVW